MTLWNRSADDEARRIEGSDADIDGRIRMTRLRFVARQLLVQQLLGEHVLPWAPWAEPLLLRWRAGYVLATRDEPGQRTTRYDLRSGTVDDRFLLSDRSHGNQLLTSALGDHAIDTMVAVRTPFLQWAGEDAAVDVGLAFLGKVRDVDTRRFKFLPTGPRTTDVDVRGLPPDEIFTEKNIGADGFTIGEATRNTDNHTGSAVVAAGFVSAEIPIVADVVVTGGARVEASHLEVTTFELFNAAATPVVATLDNVDVLPALALSWMILDDVTLKAAATRTVVRPELRELSPGVYTDVARGRARFGNPALRQTNIIHVDARIEWAWSQKDGVSAAVFGKSFDQPIESVVTAGADQAITSANVEGALNLAVEIEGRAALATFVDVGDLPVVRGAWLGGNAALIYSQVRIGADQRGTLTSQERPLERQSPWVANLQLGSADDERGSSCALLYDVFGSQVVEVGALGLPDAVEEPFHQVDVVVRQRLPAGLSLSLKATNLLDLPATRTLGGRVIDDGAARARGLGRRGLDVVAASADRAFQVAAARLRGATWSTSPPPSEPAASWMTTTSVA